MTAADPSGLIPPGAPGVARYHQLAGLHALHNFIGRHVKTGRDLQRLQKG